MIVKDPDNFKKSNLQSRKKDFDSNFAITYFSYEKKDFRIQTDTISIPAKTIKIYTYPHDTKQYYMSFPLDPSQESCKKTAIILKRLENFFATKENPIDNPVIKDPDEGRSPVYKWLELKIPIVNEKIQTTLIISEGENEFQDIKGLSKVFKKGTQVKLMLFPYGYHVGNKEEKDSAGLTLKLEKILLKK